MGKLFDDFRGGENDAGFEEKLKGLLPSLVYVYDISRGKLNYVNRAITDLLGYNLEEISQWDDGFSKLVFKEDVELVKKELERFASLKDDEVHTYNCRLNHKGGQWRYFRTRGTILRRNSEGKADSLLFIAEDISESVEFAEEIAAKKQLIEETEKMLEFGTWSWDAQTGKMEWSFGLYHLLGYDPADQNLKISIDFYLNHVEAGDREAFKEKIRWGIENKKGFEYIHTLTTSAGAKKVVSTRSNAVVSKEGELIKIIGTARDITDQMAAQKDLLYYRQMTLEKEVFLNSGSWETDLATGATSWSEGMYRLFGYDPDQEIAKRALSSDFVYEHQDPAEVIRNRKDWEEAIRSKDSYTRESVIYSRDGTTRLLETYGKIIRDPDGKASKVVGASKDITQLKKYERELERKINDLELSNAELEEFAYVASHDLQEPLRKITIFSERLSLKLSQVIDGEVVNYLRRMMNAAENMRVLIDNLLEFSRVNRKEGQFERTDINGILKESETELEFEIAESETGIVSGPLPWLEVIPLQIRQLFNNLLSNAMKFRKPGSKNTIRIESREVPESEWRGLGLNESVRYYEITVSDNGIGFEQQYAEKIFQIFTRLNGKSEYPGTGIGLAICKKIVDNHGGHISATGEMGQGAKFSIILPEKQLKNSQE